MSLPAIFVALAVAAVAGGVALLYASWRDRATHGAWQRRTGWVLIALSVVSWSAGGGAEFGPVYVTIALPLVAWGFVVASRHVRSAKGRLQTPASLNLPRFRAILQHGAIFLVAVPLAAAAGTFLVLAVSAWLPWQEVDRLALAMLAIPFVWGLLAWWATADPRLSRPALALAAGGSLGAMLCALIVSGLVAHPRIFRDAFNLRLKGSRHLEQADIHNRLSVWGVPFHLMIAVTGAYFGLALPIHGVFADAEHGGDRDAVIERVFGEEPDLRQAPGPLAVGRGLAQMDELAPRARPFFIVAHDVGEPGQFFAILARYPERLLYAENYLFDAAGNFLRTDGFADGAAGKQVVYSLYRLHFGHFGGLAVKLAYGLLGLALTVVSVTGVNVWLARRRTRDWLNDAWNGFVWGAMPAVAVAALTQVVFRLPGAAGVFWVALAAAALFALRRRDAAGTARMLRRVTAGILALLVAAYVVRFGRDAWTPAAAGVNAAFVATALVFAWTARKPRTVPVRGRAVREAT